MKAFHGDKKIKAKYLDRVRAHRKADQLVHGYYWQNGKGCAVGCTIHSSLHDSYETQLGIPETLARLEDGIFEGLPDADAMKWPEQFLSAIPVGADLSMIWPQFAHWLLVHPDFGVIRFANTDQVRDAINGVAALYQRWIAGDKPASNEWINAEANAGSAARAAREWSAWWAARAERAASAARAERAASAASAASVDSAASALRASRAARAARKHQRDKLLELLKAAPVNTSTN